MAIETTEGAAISVHFDGRRCIHARRCVTGEPTVFKANVPGPWIDADGASAEEILRVAINCPSGAITVTRKDMGAEEPAPKANKVLVRENGPLAFHAALDIVGHGTAQRATLCRCGLSNNKPFCDNSHIKGGFSATGEPEPRESALAITDLVGTVSVKPQPNGPYTMTGRMEIESGTGRSVNRVEKCFLCRCGHSKDKPYCDGSHKSSGFEAA